MTVLDGGWLLPSVPDAVPCFQLHIKDVPDDSDEILQTVQTQLEAPWKWPERDESMKVTFVPSTADVEVFLRFLLDLPLIAETQAEIEVSENLLFWSRCADWVSRLLASGEFLPGMRKGTSPGGYESVWIVPFDSPKVEHELALLYESMPGAASGGVKEENAEDYAGGVSGETQAGNRIADEMAARVRSFGSVCVDLLIRAQADPDTARGLLRAMNPRFAVPLTPAEHWLHSLLTDPKPQEKDALEWIAGEVMEWTQAAVLEQEPHAYTACYRLEEPAATGGEADGPAETGQWRLSFHLRVKDDPRLLVPAAAVWRETADTLVWRGFRFKQPQERLLEALGAAARVFPPLSRCFAEHAPTACMLTLEEAYRFLQEAAPQLQRLGQAVLVPAWWRRRPRVGLQLRLAPGEAHARPTGDGSAADRAAARSAAPGLLGFASLVDYRYELAVGDTPLSLEQLTRLAESQLPLARIGDSWVPFRPELARQFLDRYVDGGRDTGRMRLSEAVQLALDDDLEHDDRRKDPLGVRSVAAEGEVGRLLDRLRGKEPLPVRNQPNGLRGMLRPYQLQGFRWLSAMRSYGMGACLADDMGLGKTIQWIAHLLGLAENDELTGPCLLICPTSVMDNWRRELERFAPGLGIWIHYGPGRLDGDALRQQVHTTPVVLTSYATALRDEKALSGITWDTVTLDEAQNIKNTASKQTQAVRRLQASHRIALTGTPVENRLSELWSIMDFLNPGYLGSQEDFRIKFAVPIERDQEAEISGALQRIIQPFILRRVKSDESIIQDLPEKMERKEYCPLTREQADLYEAAVQKVLRQASESEGMERKGAILAALTHLKQICNHPAHYLRQGEPLPSRSGKSIRLLEMLEEVGEAGERALIFSQYAQMAKLLHVMLEEQFGTEVLLMTGDTPKKQRDEMIRRFQEDPDAPRLFVLSLKTGGFGINLTRANHVFHYDRWWNPAVENQATDRAYRIGQQRNVQVHKLISSGTMEEKIDQLMESKQSLADHVVGKGEQWITEMTTEQLSDMFALRKEMLVEEDDR
ncbi:DEAD/DEAH box helicase [Paenibacillus gansuensis]|uniref:DEAD/DEAH box helicase n=1 Tax=Paenibacillus gansuensis TaxID=306542 RepID=A0ABW5PA46_9BACL